MDEQAQHLLNRLPWVLDGSMQQREPFKRTLANEAARLAELDPYPVISLLTPLWNTPPRFLEELIASCRLQTWPHWELMLVDDRSTKTEHLAVAERWAAADKRIRLLRNAENLGISGARNVAIKASTGRYVAVLDHDDLLHPQALGLFARILRRRPEVNFLFSNEVKVNEQTTQVSEFYAKPDFDLATLERSNYICHLAVIERGLLDLVQDGEDSWFRSRYDGVEDHDLFLRLAKRREIRPLHLPVYAYYWRKTAGSTAASLDEKPYVLERGLKMLREHFGDHGAARPETIVKKGARSGNLFFSIHLSPTPKQKLAIIVPHKDQVDLTIKCLQSLNKQMHDLNLTVVLVDNGSTEPATERELRAHIAATRGTTFVWVAAPGAFNFARLNNLAVKALATTPDLLLLLNNDVELLTPDALSVMAGELEHHPRTAFAGIKLWYPGKDGLQHGGIRVTPPVAGLGFHKTKHIVGGRAYVDDEHVVHAVSFACAMVRFSVWKELSGLEEELFPNGFGDVEICTRAIQRGYSNFYLGTLEGIHHESKTRRAQSEELEASILSLLYPAELAHARRMQMGYDLHLADTFAGDEGSSWFEMHLRYRVADKVNETVKKLAGPLHKALKRKLAPHR